MSMQVSNPFKIQLVFKPANTFFYLDRFRLYEHPRNRPYFGKRIVQDAIFDYGKPVGFKLIKLNVPVDNHKLINWLQHDFKDMFDYDPLIWLASVATLPVELHQYLIPFHKEL